MQVPEGILEYNLHTSTTIHPVNLTIYTNFKEQPTFEQNLNLSNSQFQQTVTKFTVSTHRLPIKAKRFENKAPTKMIDCAAIVLGVKALLN